MACQNPDCTNLKFIDAIDFIVFLNDFNYSNNMIIDYCFMVNVMVTGMVSVIVTVIDYCFMVIVMVNVMIYVRIYVNQIMADSINFMIMIIVYGLFLLWGYFVMVINFNEINFKHIMSTIIIY